MAAQPVSQYKTGRGRSCSQMTVRTSQNVHMPGGTSPTLSRCLLRKGPTSFKALDSACIFKGALMGTPNREPQEYNRNIMRIIFLIIFLLYSWGSLLGVPNKAPSFFEVNQPALWTFPNKSTHETRHGGFQVHQLHKICLGLL